MKLYCERKIGGETKCAVIPQKNTSMLMSMTERCMSTNMFTTKSIITTPINAAISIES